jgi:UDP-N-acetylmuramoyl-L-alanyl-D-glutamate--2,6-diaminopimelate ligase
LENRHQAIRLAINLSRPGDLVLLAGKGHEDYQIIGTVKQHFDDREEAAAAFTENVT